MNETIADIIAEMRRFGNRHWMHDEGQNVRMFADRLEAAWKREELRWANANGELARMIDLEKAQGGNAAAMREALAEIRRELDCYCNGRTLLDRMTEDPPDYTCLRDSLLEIERIVDSARSTPPRNCDKYRDYESLCRAWENAVRVEGITFGKWLFAPTTERKGESDGK